MNALVLTDYNTSTSHVLVSTVVHCLYSIPPSFMITSPIDYTVVHPERDFRPAAGVPARCARGSWLQLEQIGQLGQREELLVRRDLCSALLFSRCSLIYSTLLYCTVRLCSFSYMWFVRVWMPIAVCWCSARCCGTSRISTASSSSIGSIFPRCVPLTSHYTVHTTCTVLSAKLHWITRLLWILQWLLQWHSAVFCLLILNTEHAHQLNIRVQSHKILVRVYLSVPYSVCIISEHNLILSID